MQTDEKFNADVSKMPAPELVALGKKVVGEKPEVKKTEVQSKNEVQKKDDKREEKHDEKHEEVVVASAPASAEKTKGKVVEQKVFLQH